MKSYLHLVFAGLLCITSISILLVSHGQEHIRTLDIVRLYTMRLQKGDISSALHEVKSDADFLSLACMAASNSTHNPVCLPTRQAKRDDILRHMKCTEFGSQACSYLRLVLQPLFNTLESGTRPNVSIRESGVDLRPIKTPAGETYREMLHRVIEEAPLLFHGAFKAEESDGTMVLRSSLYTLITVVIFANLLVHVVDESGWEHNHVQAIVRSIAFLLVYMISTIFVIIYPGTVTVFILILGAGALNLIYFEMFLDPTVVRPWIHPFTYAVIYMSLCALALVQNSVLEHNLFVVHLLTAAAASQIFMSNAWFNAGAKEKMRLINTGTNPNLIDVYTTKETQFGLLVGTVLQLILPLYLIMAPYNSTCQSTFHALAPLLFSVLALFSLNLVESTNLDDEYGEAMRAKEKAMGWLPFRPFATVITGAKIYASTLLLLFGATVTLVYMGEHIATARAYMDEMPEDSIQYDTSLGKRFLIGQGLKLLSAH